MSYEKQKTIEGAKWTMIIFSLTTIMSFVINLFLARLSPEIVGYYTLINIFISTITTFIFLGGGMIFPTLLPKEKSNLKKVSFIVSYFIIVLILMLIFILLLYLYPSIVEVFLEKEVSNKLFYLLLFIIPFILIMQFSQSLLNGLFEIKLSSIIEKLRIVILFFLLPLIYFINKDFFYMYFLDILIILTMISFSIGFIISFKKILSLVSFSKIRFFYFPKGFWSFMLTAQTMSILSYFFNNFDKIMVAGYLSINELGIYSIIILIWTMTRMIPQLISKTQIPLMSKLIKENNVIELNKIFSFLNRYTIIFSILLSLFILVFSFEILSLFGSEYSKHAKYLEILVFTSSFLTLSYSVTPLTISFELNKLRMVNSIILVIIQATITIVFIDKYGISAVIIAISISAIIAQLYPNYKILTLKGYSFKLPKEYLLGIVFSIIIFILTQFIIFNFLEKVLIYVASALLFTYFIGFNKQDINNIKVILKSKKVKKEKYEKSF